RAARYLVVHELRCFEIRQGQDPDDDWKFAVFNASDEALEGGYVKNRLCQHKFCARLHLVCKTLQLLRIIINSDRIGPDANDETGWLADRFPADVDALIKPMHHIGESYRIDIEYSCRIDVVAHPMRISSSKEEIPKAESVGAEQVRLHAEKILIATGVVSEALDLRRLLEKDRERKSAHAGARWRCIGNVDGVDMVRLEVFGSFNRLSVIMADGRNHLDDFDEFPTSQFRAQRGFRLQWGRRSGRRRFDGGHSLCSA